MPETEKNKAGDLMLWTIINPPAEPVYYPVKDTEHALQLLDALVESQLLDQSIGSNVFGLVMYDEDEEWIEWSDAEGDDITALYDRRYGLEPAVPGQRNPRPPTIEALRRLLHEFDQNQTVLISWNDVNGDVTVVSAGINRLESDEAAKLATRIATLLGLTRMETLEDRRHEHGPAPATEPVARNPVLKEKAVDQQASRKAKVPAKKKQPARKRKS